MRSLAASLARHRRLLSGITAAQVAAHFAMAILHIANRVAPVIIPREDVAFRDWIVVLGSTYWAVAHITAAVAILISIGIRRAALHYWYLPVLTCGISAAVWLTWSVLMLAWSANTVPPVSMAAGVLGLFPVTPTAFLCSWAWAEPPER